MILPVMAMASCSQKQASVPAIDPTDFDTTVSPAEDFYSYVNGGWMKKNPLKAEYARFGSFDVLSENNQIRLNDLFSSMTTMKTVPGSVDQKIADLYKQGLDSTRLNAEGGAPIKKYVEEIYAAACASCHSRIPVYEGSIDNMVGVLLLNRYFRALLGGRTPKMRSLLIPPCYVYKTTKLPAVLEQLRAAKQHLAVVTDEYGGVCGIVTMEDVLEQLVGEIWDESDTVEEEVVERAEGEWELDGDMSIGDFTELLDVSEDAFETESSTVGGWTLEKFGGFPKDGESFETDGLSVTVLKMDGLRVEKILIRREAPAEEE